MKNILFKIENYINSFRTKVNDIKITFVDYRCPDDNEISELQPVLKLHPFVHKHDMIVDLIEDVFEKELLNDLLYYQIVSVSYNLDSNYELVTLHYKVVIENKIKYYENRYGKENYEINNNKILNNINRLKLAQSIIIDLLNNNIEIKLSNCKIQYMNSIGKEIYKEEVLERFKPLISFSQEIKTLLQNEGFIPPRGGTVFLEQFTTILNIPKAAKDKYDLFAKNGGESEHIKHKEFTKTTIYRYFQNLNK